MLNKPTLLAIAIAAPLLAAAPAQAQEQVLNLYSARHYSTDEALYANFTKATGIKINRVDADDAGILARLKAEGSASPADVILLVDAARLVKGETDGLFLPVKSKVLDDAIPAQYRAKPAADGTPWFGFSTRARVIVYDKLKVKREDVASYEDLGDPKNKGRLCIRSGSHPYNLSLFGAVTEHLGEAKAEAWLKGMVANMARAPKGGDTDQIKGVASGECGIGVTNTYYLARMMRSNNADDRAVVEKVGVVFPNQSSWGTHLNIAGGAVAKYAKNQANGGEVSGVPGQPRGAELLCQRQQRVAHRQGREDRQPGPAGHGRRRLQDRDHSAGRCGRQPGEGAADAGPRGLQVSPAPQHEARSTRCGPFLCQIGLKSTLNGHV